MNNDRFAKTVRLREPSTGRLFVPVKMKKRETEQFGFRIIPTNDNLAASDEVTDSEQVVVSALKAGLSVRCVPLDDPDSPANALALGARVCLRIAQVEGDQDWDVADPSEACKSAERGLDVLVDRWGSLPDEAREVLLQIAERWPKKTGPNQPAVRVDANGSASHVNPEIDRSIVQSISDPSAMVQPMRVHDSLESEFEESASEIRREILQQWADGVPSEIREVLSQAQIQDALAIGGTEWCEPAEYRIAGVISTIAWPIRDAIRERRPVVISNTTAVALAVLTRAARALADSRWLEDLEEIRASGLLENRDEDPGLKRTHSSLVQRDGDSRPKADAVDEVQSDPRLADWQNGVPAIVAVCMDPDTRERISRLPKAKRRVTRSIRSILRISTRTRQAFFGLVKAQGDAAVKAAMGTVGMKKFSLAEVRALRSLGPPLEAIDPWGRSWHDLLKAIEPVLGERERELEAQRVADADWHSVIPAEFRPILNPSVIDSLLLQKSELDWFVASAHALGFDKAIVEMPGHFEAQAAEWMAAVDRLIRFADQSVVASGTKESGYARSYRKDKIERLDLRQTRLREALQKVSVGDWRSIGPLKASGYRVDAVRPLSVKQRHETLRDLLWVDLEFLREKDRDIHRKAGLAGTAHRRAWILGYLKSFVSLHGERPQYASAVTKWQDDLEWLERH